MAVPKITANRGDVAEAILGAACCAVFKKRPFEQVQKKDIDENLDAVLRDISVTFRANDYVKNAKSKVKDNITFRLALPVKAMEFLKKKDQRPLVADLYDSCIKYVNSNAELQAAAKNLYSNEVQNEIEILSDGTTDQKGTKADIKMFADGKTITKQISLKVEGGEQFAQMGGAAWETQEKLFTESLGVSISAVKGKYEEALYDYDSTAKFVDRGKDSDAMLGYLKAAAKTSYKQAATNMKLDVGKKEFKQRLADFIRYGATLNDEFIELLKLTGGDFKSQTFGPQWDALFQQMTFTVDYRDTGDAQITINASTPDKKLSGPLIKIRAKFERPSAKVGGTKMYSTYMRNYIEAPTNSILYKL